MPIRSVVVGMTFLTRGLGSGSRIPIENIYYLLCYAWKALDEREVVGVDASTAQTLPNLFARVLCNGVRHLIRRGIDRGYRPHAEEIPGIRGHVLVQNLARRPGPRTTVPCEFDEFDHDVLQNQILKATLRLLLKCDDIDPGVRETLRDQVRVLAAVSDVPLASSLFRRVQVHRNNRVYGFLLRVCELVYENVLPAEGDGPRKFRDFAGDPAQMGALFEGFIRSFYDRHLPPQQFSVTREDIRWQLTAESDEGAKYLPKMQTDVTLRAPSRKVIIECKFTPEALHRNFDAERVRSAHLYQVFAYLTNLTAESLSAVAEVIILYPTVDRPLSLTYRDPRGRPISVKTINLAQPWQNIHQDLLALVA